jgi:hypothetical protein
VYKKSNKTGKIVTAITDFSSRPGRLPGPRKGEKRDGSGKFFRDR